MPRIYEHSGWEALRFPLTREKQGQAQKPDYDFVSMGLLFPQNDPTEIIYLTTQMSHKWQLESGIRPHMHYVQDEAEEPIWKLDYRWYLNGADPTGGFTTITATTFAYIYTAGSILQIVSWPEIDGTGINTLSSIIDLKVYRDDNIVAGDVLGKEFDIHYIHDSIGSVEEFLKN